MIHLFAVLPEDQTDEMGHLVSSLGFGRNTAPPTWREEADVAMLLPGFLGPIVSRCSCLGENRPRGKRKRQLTPDVPDTRANSSLTNNAQRLHSPKRAVRNARCNQRGKDHALRGVSSLIRCSWGQDALWDPPPPCGSLRYSGASRITLQRRHRNSTRCAARRRRRTPATTARRLREAM